MHVYLTPFPLLPKNKIQNKQFTLGLQPMQGAALQSNIPGFEHFTEQSAITSLPWQQVQEIIAPSGLSLKKMDSNSDSSFLQMISLQHFCSTFFNSNLSNNYNLGILLFQYFVL